MEIKISELNEFGKLHFAISSIEDGNMSFLYGDKNMVLANRENFLKKQTYLLVNVSL